MSGLLQYCNLNKKTPIKQDVDGKKVAYCTRMYSRHFKLINVHVLYMHVAYLTWLNFMKVIEDSVTSLQYYKHNNMYMYNNINVHVYMYNNNIHVTCMYMDVCLLVHIHVHDMYIVYVHVHACIYNCMFVHVYLSVYIYICLQLTTSLKRNSCSLVASGMWNVLIATSPCQFPL